MSRAHASTHETAEHIERKMERTLCVFQTKMDPSDAKYCMAILGSVPEVGSWDRVSPIVAAYDKDRGVWRVHVELPLRHDIEYKWIIYNLKIGNIVSYEPGNNRHIRVDNHSLLIDDVENGVQNIREINKEEMVEIIPNDHDIAITQNKPSEGILSTDVSDEYVEQQLKQLNSKIFVHNQYRQAGEFPGETSKKDHSVVNQFGYVERSSEELSDETSKYPLSVVARVNDVDRSSEDGLTDGDGSWSKLKKMFSKNKDCMLKIGLIAGASITAVFLYKKLFRR